MDGGGEVDVATGLTQEHLVSHAHFEPNYCDAINHQDSRRTVQNMLVVLLCSELMM